MDLKVFWKKFGMFALLLVLVAAFSLASPDTFFTTITLFNILKQASIIGVLSCGMTLLLIMGEIDISVGSRIAMTTLICGKLLTAGWPIWIVILFAIVFGALTGVLNGFLAQLLRTNVFVVTMATNYIWMGAGFLYNGAATLTGFPDAFKSISQFQIFGAIPSIAVIFAACAVISGFILAKTYFGRYLYAIGGNREAAYLAGINVKKNTLFAHLLAGVFFGIGAIILMSRTMSATANTGSSFAFECITACVLGGGQLVGGQGKMYQAMLGVLVIYVIFNGLTILGVTDYWQMALKGVLLLIAIGIEVVQRTAKVELSDKIGTKPNKKELKTAAAE